MGFVHANAMSAIKSPASLILSAAIIDKHRKYMVNQFYDRRI